MPAPSDLLSYSLALRFAIRLREAIDKMPPSRESAPCGRCRRTDAIAA